MFKSIKRLLVAATAILGHACDHAAPPRPAPGSGRYNLRSTPGDRAW